MLISEFDNGQPMNRDVFVDGIWRACSQASAHPTTSTDHKPIDPEQLAVALAMVIGHFEKVLYANHDRRLIDIVRSRK